MERSASGAGVSVSVLELLAALSSGVGLAIVDVLARLAVRLELTGTTSVKICGAAPAASDGCVAVIFPFAPTAVLSVRVQPAGKASETKVVPRGSASLIVKACASLGPALLTVMA